MYMCECLFNWSIQYNVNQSNTLTKQNKKKFILLEINNLDNLQQLRRW